MEVGAYQLVVRACQSKHACLRAPPPAAVPAASRRRARCAGCQSGPYKA